MLWYGTTAVRGNTGRQMAAATGGGVLLVSDNDSKAGDTVVAMKWFERIGTLGFAIGIIALVVWIGLVLVCQLAGCD